MPLLFWVQKCMVHMYPLKQNKNVWVFQGIYQSWNLNLLKYTCSMSLFFWTGTVSRYFKKIIAPRVFWILKFDCSMDSSWFQKCSYWVLSSPKENRSDSLPGYLPKLEFKYFKIMFHLTAVVHRIPELYGWWVLLTKLIGPETPGIFTFEFKYSLTEWSAIVLLISEMHN